jgi:hypothetical protein
MVVSPLLSSHCRYVFHLTTQNILGSLIAFNFAIAYSNNCTINGFKEEAIQED